MAGQQDRRRSPSAGHMRKHNINHQSSSPNYDQSSGLGLDPSISSSTFSTGSFNAGLPSSNIEQYNFQGDYLNANVSPAAQFQQHTLPSNHFPDQEFRQAYKHRDSISDGQQRPSSLSLQQSNHQFTNEFLDANSSADFSSPFSQSDMSGKQDLLMLDPSLQTGGQPPNQSINPADLMNSMSTPHNHLPTPPNVMSLDSRSPPGQSPSPHQNRMYSPNHSRQVSLDPASAAFLQHGQQPTDWTGMLGGASFQQHRRAPSEHSDVSSSVAPSPFLQQDSFENYDQNPSPMLNAQHDSLLYQDAFGIERFSLSDQQQQQQQQNQQQHRGLSPGHSPYVSPRITPHPGLGISQDNHFVLASNDMNNHFAGGPGPQIYNGTEPEFTGFQMKHEASDMGQAAQMAPPEINVELAPPSRQQNFELNQTENDLDALSPPERGRRGRIRAKSDPSFAPGPRAMSPAEASSHPVSIDTAQRNRSLSPFDASYAQAQSRDVSPASKSSRRSSTSSIPNRDYILELADPTRPSANGADRQGRVQKHPANFQCTLCPKRFTRAYNLRSHLRTHTDERPFVCTVCGKAFARQHDRKRHEGLHSGEKKFVCRGELGAGGSWGCGRRFARADALGRHFRSEAGRVCIKPLLDEEAMERQRLYDEHMMHQQQQGMQPGGGPGGVQPPSQMMDMNTGGFTLPAALLAQYPALQGLQWDQLGSASGGPGDEGELSARSSFDASSGGDYFDDEEGGSGYVSGPGTGYGNAWAGAGAAGSHDWASDYEGR